MEKYKSKFTEGININKLMKYLQSQKSIADVQLNQVHFKNKLKKIENILKYIIKGNIKTINDLKKFVIKQVDYKNRTQAFSLITKLINPIEIIDIGLSVDIVKPIKYELINKTKTEHGQILYRIRALKDFNDVKKGNIGGFVENYNVLSQYGNCWIYDNAVVEGDRLLIKDNAQIRNKAEILESEIFGNVIISGNTTVLGGAVIKDNVEISGKVRISATCIISDNVKISGEAQIDGNDIKISKNTRILGDAVINSDTGFNYDKGIYRTGWYTDGVLDHRNFI